MAFVEYTQGDTLNQTSTANMTTFTQVMLECTNRGHPPERLPILLIVLVLAYPSNLLLLYALLKNFKDLSNSEVLGLNFAVLGLLYCLALTLDLAVFSKEKFGFLVRLSYAFAVLSYFGCPLLLSFLCIERYVAVSHPVLFIKLGKWQYRAACSAIIWILTCITAVLTFVYAIYNTVLWLSVSANLMFFIMVVCLIGIVWELCEKGPGDAKSGKKSDSPIKKRAIKHIMAILVPSIIVYFPLLMLIPFLVLMRILVKNISSDILCLFMMLFGVIPSFGVCIGPMFYKARVMQTLGNNANETMGGQKIKKPV